VAEIPCQHAGTMPGVGSGIDMFGSGIETLAVVYH
jgi:hypothetical protein